MVNVSKNGLYFENSKSDIKILEARNDIKNIGKRKPNLKRINWSMDKSNDGIFKNLLRVLLYQLIKEGIVRTVDKDQDEVYCHSENINTFRGEHINCNVRTSCQKCNNTSKFTKNCRSADPYKQQIVQKGHYRTLKFD